MTAHTAPARYVLDEAAPVSEAAVQAALNAVATFWREAHAVLQAYPSAQLARAMLEAAAPLIRAEAESERDRFREQARILGAERSEWACDRCDVIHPWRDGDRFTAACPDCDGPMLPTSLSSRLLAGARTRAGTAEAKLAEVRAVLLEGGQGDATARCRAIAIVGTGETQDRSDEKEAQP